MQNDEFEAGIGSADCQMPSKEHWKLTETVVKRKKRPSGELSQHENDSREASTLPKFWASLP
jgi:hypothetical protein